MYLDYIQKHYDLEFREIQRIIRRNDRKNRKNTSI